MDLADNESQPDMRRLRAYRLGRVREKLREANLAGIVLFDPANVRYASGTRNMPVWTLHNAARYCFVATEGPVVLFEYPGASHLVEGIETVHELRPALAWFYFAGGARYEERAATWAAEIADLVSTYGGGNRRLAADHCDVLGLHALEGRDVEVLDGQKPMEDARGIKSGDEVECMKRAIAVCAASSARSASPRITSGACGSGRFLFRGDDRSRSERVRWATTRSGVPRPTQQYVERAGASVDIAGRAEGIDRVVAPQPVIDLALDDGETLRGTVPLAVDDAHAAKPVAARRPHEVADAAQRLGRSHAAQVDFVLDRPPAAAEIPEHSALQARAQVGEAFPGFGEREGGIRGAGDARCSRLRAGLPARSGEVGRPRVVHRSDRSHRFAKERDVFRIEGLSRAHRLAPLVPLHSEFDWLGWRRRDQGGA